METVIKLIREALAENLETIVLMLIVTNTLFGINIVLGTIIGTITEHFNTKKFFFGILKQIITSMCIFAFCYTLNLFALTLQLTNDITISADFITTIEVFAILVTWAIDLSKDILAKIKGLKELKYISYDDVQVNTESDVGIG